MQNLKTRAALISIGSNTLLIILKLVVGITMCSISVISEAVHSGIDLIAALIAFFCIKAAGKQPNHEHQYGHGKIESVAGTAEAILIFGAAAYIIKEAIEKLYTGHYSVHQVDIGVMVMGISALVNFFVSSYLMRTAKKSGSIALEADAMHLRTDVYTSLGVVAGLVAIRFTGLAILDPIIAIVVALLIVKAAYDLTKTALRDVLDTKLTDDEEAVILDILVRNNERYVEYHKLRTRKSGNTRFIDLHVVVPAITTVGHGHALSHDLADEINDQFENSQTMVHIEPCSQQCHMCKIFCDIAA